MIKLFWNTRNQKKPNTKDEKIIEELDRNYVWGLYHKKNSNLWVYEILKKIKYDIIENETNLEKDDTLIIVDSSLEGKAELYKKLKKNKNRIMDGEIIIKKAQTNGFMNFLKRLTIALSIVKKILKKMIY